MPGNNNLNMIFHHIRVKLYKNNLKNVEGAYIVKTDNDRILSFEDVCRIMKTRGGVTGNYEDLLQNLRQYYNEVAYQLCDGFAVTNGLYTIYPNIGGSFNSVNEARDRKKHPIDFRFRARLKLRELAENITVDVAGLANTSGCIDTFTDYDVNSSNDVFAPGHQFAIHGSKIKIAGDNPDNGVYFAPAEDPSKAVKATRIADNTYKKITGIVPDDVHGLYHIEIRTQYTGATNTLLKKPRAITSTFTIEAA